MKYSKENETLPPVNIVSKSYQHHIKYRANKKTKNPNDLFDGNLKKNFLIAKNSGKELDF